MEEQGPPQVKTGRIKTIPSEILITICGFLQVPSILQVSQVCTSWRKLIVESDAVWKEAFSRTFSSDLLEFSKISPLNTYKEELQVRVELLRRYQKGSSSNGSKKLVYKVLSSTVTDAYMDFNSHRLVCHSAIDGTGVLSDPTIGKRDAFVIFTGYFEYIKAHADAREKPFHLENLLSCFDASRFGFAYPSSQDAGIVYITILSKDGRHRQVLYTTISHPFAVSCIWLTKSSDPRRCRHAGSSVPGNIGLITGDLSGRVWIWNVSTPSRIAAYHLIEPAKQQQQQPTTAAAAAASELPIIGIYADSRYKWILVVNSAGSIFVSNPHHDLSNQQANSFQRFSSFSNESGPYLGIIPDFAKQRFIRICRYSIQRFQLDDDNKTIDLSGEFQSRLPFDGINCFNAVEEPSKQQDELLDMTTPGQGSRIFATCESSGIIKIWNMRSSHIGIIHPLVSIQPTSLSMSIGINSLVLAASGYDGSVEIFDIISGEFIRKVQKPFKHSDQISSEERNEYGQLLCRCKTTIVDSDSTRLRGVSAIGHLVTFWDYGGGVDGKQRNSGTGIGISSGQRRHKLVSDESRRQASRKEIEKDISSDYESIKRGQMKREEIQSKIDKLNGKLCQLSESEQFAYATMLSREEEEDDLQHALRLSMQDVDMNRQGQQQEQEHDDEDDDDDDDDDLKRALALSMKDDGASSSSM